MKFHVLIVLSRWLCYSKVIWLGDLNYRLSASSDVHEQLRNHDWEALLEKDQVSIILI